MLMYPVFANDESQPFESVILRLTVNDPGSVYRYVGLIVLPMFTPPSPNAHSLETIALPPPPVEESLKLTFRGTHPERGGVAPNFTAGLP